MPAAEGPGLPSAVFGTPQHWQEPDAGGPHEDNRPGQAFQYATREGEGQPRQTTPDQRQAIVEAGQRAMRAAGLPESVALKVLDHIDRPGPEADARYTRGLIELAMDTPAEQLPGKLFHEIVHAAMDPDLGVLAPKERLTLLAQADRWLKQGDNAARMVRLGYDGLQLREEAVARMGEEALQRGMQPSTIYSRIVNFVGRIGNWFRGMGFKTARDVFDSLMSGERAAPSGERASLRSYATRTAGKKADEAKKITDEIHTLFSPTSRGAAAEGMEAVVRRRSSLLARSSNQTLHRLDHFARDIDRLPEADQLDITHRVETGQTQRTPELQAAMTALNAEQNRWLKMLQSIGQLKHVLNSDDYMGRIYSNYKEWKAGQPAPTMTEAERRAMATGVGRVEGPEAGCAAGDRSLTLRRIFPTSFFKL